MNTSNILPENDEVTEFTYDVNRRHSQMVYALAKDGNAILASLTPEKCDLLHHAIGICTEAGELLDAVKKHVIYGQEFNLLNGVEELGDLEFYMKGMRGSRGITRDDTLNANLNKLAKRYKDYQYSDQQAKMRNDKAEGEI